LPLAAERVLDIVITRAQYERPLYVATTAAQLRVENRDPELHTLSLRKLGVVRAHLPLPPRSQLHPINFGGGAGRYELACENHASERALLVLFDHPYFTVTGADGRFAIEGVPPGTVTLVVSGPGGAEQKKLIIVGRDALADAAIELSEDEG
jgi:hypothetical protein